MLAIPAEPGSEPGCESGLLSRALVSEFSKHSRPSNRIDKPDKQQIKNSAIKLNPSARPRLTEDSSSQQVNTRLPLIRVLEPSGQPRILIDEGERASSARRPSPTRAKDGQEASPVPAAPVRAPIQAQDGQRHFLAPLRWSSRRRPSSNSNSSSSDHGRRTSEQSQHSVHFQILSEDDEENSTNSLRASISSSASGHSSELNVNIRVPQTDVQYRASVPNENLKIPHNFSFQRFRNSSISILRNSSRIFHRRRMSSNASTSADAGGQKLPQQKQQDGTDDTPTAFLRNDSIMIHVKPGQCFSEYSNVLVDLPARCDPRLGTLGELRHNLRTGTKAQVKRFLRQNNWTSGHRIRSELWKELCHDKNSDAQRAVYRDTVDKLGAIQTSPTFLSVPGVVLCDHQLKENGRLCLLRLLTAVEHHRPDFTYVPVLYPLGALFLHYMTEEEAFACIMNLISQSQKFLIQTDIATAASKRTMLVLVKKHVKNAYVLFKRLTNLQDDKDIVAIFDDWKSWIFRDLPFSHLVRIVDCFLFEGQKVLFRVALAIVSLWYEDRGKKIQSGKAWTTKEIADDVSEYCKTIKVQPPKLLKTAFGVRNLKMSTVSRLQQKHELNLRHSVSGVGDIGLSQNTKQAIATHHYIDINLDSQILEHNQAMQLISWIPSRYQLHAPCKLFSSDEDGTSFTRLWTKLESLYPTVIIIKTSRGEVFGAYCSEAWDTWKRHSGMAYFGTGETFLFRFVQGAKEGEKFSWVGTKKTSIVHSEELFQAADQVTLVVGGGSNEAISIRQTLESGSSGHCDTFDNPPFSSSHDFDIQTLEVFGFLSDQ